MTEKREFNLLFPEEYRDGSFILDEQTQNDLEINVMIDFIANHKINRTLDFIGSRKQIKNAKEILRNILFHPVNNADVISYRQDVFEYLIKYDFLLDAFEQLYLIINVLRFYKNSNKISQTLMYEVVTRIGELESYLHAIDTLHNAFKKITSASGMKELNSTGLNKLFEFVKQLYKNKAFLHLKEHLPELAIQIRKTKSINIGINLGDSLRPTEATIVSINKERYNENSETVFSMLFNKQTHDLHGITPLRTQYNQSPTGEVCGTFIKQLLVDLAETMEKACLPIKKALNRYIKINTQSIINLQDDIAFYILATRALLKIKEKGLEICRPEILKTESGDVFIEHNYNINLAIQMMKQNINIKENIVCNKVSINDNGRILLITGPNQGGKTVYVQSVGLTQVLFQSGLFIPGSRAKISPVDSLFTHFQIEESLSRQMGRFGDEAERLNKILTRATPDSMILMNESFASTNYVESLCIARDIMKVMRMLGARVVFSTHFHDLAAEAEEINKNVKGRSRLISLVSMVEKANNEGNVIKRTFRIEPHSPLGSSYAREIAVKYKIGFHQLTSLLKQRGFTG